VTGVNGWAGLLSATPWIVTGKPARSMPVVTSTACIRQRTAVPGPTVYVLATK